jgi:antitoxin component of MazEF toxin-antitoxin module
MNNFVFGQDPLLYSTTLPQYQQQDVDIKKQLDTVMAQYQMMQQKQQSEPSIEDHIGNLDNMVKNLDPAVTTILESDAEFIQINAWIQQMIQNEIMKSVKMKLNTNQDVIMKVNRAKELIQQAKNIQDNEDRKSLNELNDYITNYSDMTFNEYKQLKAMKQK